MTTEIKTIPSRLHFAYLPAFAKFIRDNHFEGFIKRQVKLMREMKLPLLRFFESTPERQLIELSKTTAAEFLQFLIDNKAREQIDDSLQKWIGNELPQVAKEQIVAEDITLVSFMRKQAFLEFLPLYSSDPKEIIDIIRELDTFMLESETASTNTFIQLLKDRINEETHFKERIINTSPGIVYIVDLITQKDIYSNAKLNTRLGYSEAELHEMGTSLLETIIHPGDAAAVAEHKKELLSTKEGEIRSFKFRVKTKDGSYRWQQSYESIFRKTDSGEALQIIGIAYDIQDEMNIAEQLKYQEDRLLEAQELAEIGSFEWNLTTGESNMTPQLIKILQLGKGDFPELFLSKVHPADKSRIEATLQNAIKENGLYDFEYRYRINTTEKILWSRGTVSVRDGSRIMKGTIMDVTDRHYMIQRLQRSEQLYKQAQAITHIGNYTWELGSGKLNWSDELYHIYELDPSKEINYDIVFTFTHPDDVNHVNQSIQRTIETHEPFDFYYRIILQNHKVKILQARGELLADEAGKPFKLLGTAQDVTERQELISRLQESDYLYKQAQTLTRIGNWSWDLRQNTLSWSDELYHIFGLNPQSSDISFETFMSFIHPEDKEIIATHISKPHDIHYRIIDRDGNIKILHGKGEVLMDASENPYKMIGTSQDVTEEKLIEKQLRDNQNFIQKIADATPSIIGSYNIRTGKYLFMNQGLKKLLGYEPQQVLRKGTEFFADLIHPDDATALLEKNKKALEAANQTPPLNNNEIIVEYQYRIRHKNGKYRWFHTYGTIFDRDVSGKVEHVLNISLDITERMEAEQVLFQKNIELRQSNASLEEFAYVASHDLQEPLRKISTFGERLVTTQRDKLDEEGKMYLEKVINSSIRMQQMINDLLAVSMISGNKAFQLHSLQEILNEVLETLEHKIEKNKATVTSDELPKAIIVPSQFRQLFQNLLANSLKFARAQVPPEIKISCQFMKHNEVKQYNLVKANRYLQLKFSDNGIGFKKIFADKIFTIFQRLHSRSEYEGTGIGLAICKKIVENHGGVIFASGELGKGACFTVIIPA